MIVCSEREPDDWEDDPSLHPTHTTMFMEKSKQAIINGMSRKKSQMHLAGSQSIGDFTTLKKASSCSTIYIDDSTVSQPNLKNTIKCVSLAIYYHIKNRNSDTILDIFDEKKQPLTVQKIFTYLLNSCCIFYLFPCDSGTRCRQITPSTILTTGKSTNSSAPCSMRRS